MDIKLYNRDIVFGKGGNPVTLTGIDEIIQKIKIALTAPKGSFIYDRNLGAFENGFDPQRDTPASLEMILNECLIDCGCSVEVLGHRASGNRLYALLKVNDGFKNYEREVLING